MNWIRRGTSVFFVALLSHIFSSAQVLPFFTETALTVGFESNAFRTYSRFVSRNRLELEGSAIDDPADQSAEVFVQVFAFPVRLGPGTVLTVAAPVLYGESNFTTPGFSPTRLDASGLGDITLTVRQRFYQNDFLGGGVQGAVIAGVKLPSGDHDQRDARGSLVPRGLQPGSGSVDFPLGLVFTAFKDRIGFNSDLIHRFNNERDAFRSGDETRVDVALGYRLFPAEFKSFQDKVVSLYLEFNTSISQHARFNGFEVLDSGGSIGFLTPGIQAVLTPRFLIEAAIQLPAFQKLNGTQLAFAPTANFGIRLLF